MSRSNSDLHIPTFVLFFISGFCSLLYQIVWVRIAFSHFGVITPVLSVVLSVFMLGLAVGSWAAGRWIDPLKKKLRISAIYFYALAELIVAAGAFVVPWAYSVGDRWLLSADAMNSWKYLSQSALVILLSLLPWCIAMGATMPLMMSFWREKQGSSTKSFSWLYLANVLGAASGCLLTAGVLIECLGFRHTLAVAGGLNLLIALLAASLGRKQRFTPVPERPFVPSPGLQTPGLSWAGSLGVLFLTGLLSMSAEVIWIRSFVPVLSTTVYAFASILAVYLISTAAGSFGYRHWASSKQWLSLSSLAAGLCTGSLLPAIVNDPRLHLGGLPHLLSIAPFCALLGYLTPYLIDTYSSGHPAKAGWAYAVNVLGCIVGPLIASYFILPVLGTRIGMIVSTLPLFGLYIISSRKLSIRRLGITLVPILLLLYIGTFVSLSYEEPNRIDPRVQVRRDYAATVISYGTGNQKILLVNGHVMTGLQPVTKVMAHLPLGFHAAKAHSALMICFGMGTTYRSLLSWGVSTTAIELVPSVKDAFPFYFADATDVLKNPLGQIVIDDGRRYLKRTTAKFDVITLDPPPPIETAGSSLLYSRDFYEEIKMHLESGGILQQWFPGGEARSLRAVTRSLKDAFPYVRLYKGLEGWGFHFLASMEPLKEPGPEQFISRLPPKAKNDLLEWGSSDGLKGMVKRMLGNPISLDDFPMDRDNIYISDDHPLNEYYFLRRIWARWHDKYLEIT